MRMKAAETSASSAIADCTPLAVVSRSLTTAEIDTFIKDVSTTRTNIAIASSTASLLSPRAACVVAGRAPAVTWRVWRGGFRATSSSMDDRRYVALRMRRSCLLVLAVALAALLLPAAAGAHAFLVRTSPAAGGSVGSAPREVRLVFSAPVRPAAPTGVYFAGKSVVAGKPYVPKGAPNEIVIPLRAELSHGPYAVRWSEVDIDDGHLISGAFIFSVGAGSTPIPSSTLAAKATSHVSAALVVARWLELAGILVAAGVVGFALLVARRRPDAPVLAAALAVAALGAVLSVVLDHDATGTRFGRWTIVGACVAGVGAAAALASRRVPPLLPVATAAAILLVGLPTATGHASAAGVVRWISIPADLLHLAAAAFWVGGVLDLLRLRDRETLVVLGRRFTPYALATVALLGATGVVRAVNELDAVDQVWTTGYGRTLIVKTVLFAALLTLGWFNRNGIRRARVAVELVVLGCAVVAVAVLVNLRPPRDHVQLASATAAASRTVV